MQNSTIKILCFLIFFHICKTTTAQNILASKGKAIYNVVTPFDGSASEKFAANELIRYLNQISGSKFVLSNHLKDKSIVVCDASSFIKMNVKNSPSLHNEMSAILVRNNVIYLIGGNDRSVIYSVYTFLNKIGCQWFSPEFSFFEGRSQKIPFIPELKYEQTNDLIENPAFSYRKLYVEEGITHTIDNLIQLIDWMPKLKFNTLVIPIDYQGRGLVKWDNWREKLTPQLEKRGIIIEVGGHGYQNFLNAQMNDGKLFEDNPEWFGEDISGNRSKEKRYVFCTSSDSAVKYIHNSVLSYLKERPEIDIFDFWPPDGAQWCNCEKCRVSSPTDRHLAFVSSTAKFLKEKLPNLKLECLAYSSYVAPPKNEKLNKLVLLDFCPINQSFESQIYEEDHSNNKIYKEYLLQWFDIFEGDISIYSYYRKYTWFSLPNIIPHYIQNDLKYYKKLGVKGISIYSEPGDWFTYGPNYYVLGHLAQNPDISVEKLMRDYSKGVFHEASDAALTVYKKLEKVVPFGTRLPHSTLKTVDLYKGYASVIDSCHAIINREITENASNSVSQNHLKRLSLMLEYVSLSIKERRTEVESGVLLKTNRISDDVKVLFEKNVDQGVFVIR